MNAPPHINAAIHAHRAGRLDEADTIYRAILTAEVGNPDALHLLGLLFYQRSRPEDALPLIEKALSATPQAPVYHGSLAMIFRALGKLDEAEEAYRHALELDASMADVWSNFAVLLLDRGRSGEAEDACRKALALRPGFTQALANLGHALVRQGRDPEAADAYRDALTGSTGLPKLRLGWVQTLLRQGRNLEALAAAEAGTANGTAPQEAWLAHALALEALGRSNEALSLLEKLITFARGYAPAWMAFARVTATDQPNRAVDILAEAARMLPQDVGILNEWANRLADRGRFDEAGAVFLRLCTLHPDDVEPIRRRSAVLARMGRIVEARSSVESALNLAPDNPAVLDTFAAVLILSGEPGKAERTLRRLVSLQPDHANGWRNFGKLLKEQGRLDEAITADGRTVAVDPDAFDSWHNLLMHLQASPRHDGTAIRTVAEAWGRRAAALASPIPHSSYRQHGRLRVGYVSPDFRSHSVSFFFEPVLRMHDRTRVEVFCYAEVPRPDATTERLRAMAEHWRDTVGRTDAEVAAQVAADGINVLVDLAGHTSGNRLGMFALRPAPVQVTWLGYPGTTGLPAVGWRLTDTLSDPPGEDHHSEHLIRLPNGFLCYQPSADAPPVADLPAAGRGAVTFGSFNALHKVTPEVVRLWSDILARVPGSQLVVKAAGFGDPSIRSMCRDRFEAAGVAPERVDLLGQTPDRGGHLALYGMIDIGLDTFPYNGTTTTCEALWMGVPVVTLAGSRHAARVGHSLLARVGLDELISTTPEGYAAIAADLAGNLGRLSELRRGLRARLSSSLLCDAARFTAELEEAYAAMIASSQPPGIDSERGSP